MKSGIALQMILHSGAQLNFQFSLLQLHTKSLCVLALQNSQFEASTSSRPQTVNFEALGHKAIPSGVFRRGSGVIWPICYFDVGNLCYGRLSFRVSKDECSAHILHTLHTVSDSVLNALTQIWSERI